MECYMWSWNLWIPGEFALPGHWSPAWCTRGHWAPCSGPMDMAAASPFVGSTSSKAEAHTNTEDTQKMLTWIVTQDAIQKTLPWNTPSCNTTRTHRWCEHNQPSTLPSLHLARIEAQLVKAHTWHCRFTRAHTHLQIPEEWHGPSVCPVPLPVPWALLPVTLDGSPPHLLVQLGAS